MGLFNALLGNSSEIDPKELENNVVPLLIDGEKIEHAYRLIRDVVCFTNKRLILVDKQGMSGKKQEIMSVPYSKIVKFSKENAGRMDMDAEIKVWVHGEALPMSFSFQKNTDLNGIYKALSDYIL
ncbi:MAG: PH domain-containing protein [Trueperaceae bacterium]